MSLIYHFCIIARLVGNCGGRRGEVWGRGFHMGRAGKLVRNIELNLCVRPV